MNYIDVWLAENKLPAPCAKCKDPVVSIGGRRSRLMGVVHHVDEDRTNNVAENLVVMHHGCHVSHHKRGHKMPPSHGAKVSAALSGKTKTAEHRAALSAAMKGRTLGPRSDTHKQHIREALTGVPHPRVECEECGESVSSRWMSRHKCKAAT